MTDLGEAVRHMRERTELATIIYGALRNSSRSVDVKILTYRCIDRCRLLDVIDTPHGLLVGFPRYKTSPNTTAETSNESGRAANTEDGQRRWKQHAAFIESVSNPPLSCDHLHSVPLDDASIEADHTQGHTEVIVRRDGSRYAVQ